MVSDLIEETMFGPQPVTRADPQAGRRRNQARYRGKGRDWETPWDFFHRLDAEFGFTLDPCCTHETAKVAKHFTEEDNGLSQSWKGETVFMNPPYGAELYAWTRRAREAAKNEGAIVVGLLPAATDTEWFHDNVIKAGAEVRYVRGRIRFKVKEAWASPFQPNIIVVWKPISTTADVR